MRRGFGLNAYWTVKPDRVSMKLAFIALSLLATVTHSDQSHDQRDPVDAARKLPHIHSDQSHDQMDPVDAARKLPHIILMLADDLGNYEVGYHNPRAITPSIDELARDGVILERHYTYHMCGPTRSATMTGRLPFHNNQQNVNDINATE